MTAQPRKHANPTGAAPRQLIEAAHYLFARQGFDGTSVKELADRAGVNVSLISYHFGGKEGLYLACLEEFGRGRLEAAQRLLVAPENFEEFKVRLKMFVEEILSTHVEQNDICTIIMRECDMKLPHARDVFRETMLKNFEMLVGFFKSAQNKGIVRKGLDPLIIGLNFHGAILSCARHDRMGEEFFGRTIKDPKYREKLIDHFLELLCHGCVKEASS